jgi:hypothetical protein
MRVFPAGAALLAGAVVAVSAVPAAAGEADPARLSFTATLNDRALADIGPSDPLRLSPRSGVLVTVRMRNGTRDAAVVRSVRLESRLLGVAFVSTTTRIDARLPAGGTAERRFAVDLAGIDGQATGLLSARLALLSDHRRVLAAQTFPVDVRGRLVSVYGLFGLAVLGMTLLLLVAAVSGLVARRLPAPRWGRALCFGAPGVGAGISLLFLLSVLRVLPPAPAPSLVVVLSGAVIGLLFGVFTPGPLPRSAPASVPPAVDLRKVVDLRRRLAAESATVRASGQRPAAAATERIPRVEPGAR